MRVITGDLIAMARAGEVDVVVHGANCQCTMGAGFAKALRAAFPQAYEADLRTPKGERGKLGTVSVAEVRVRSGAVVIVNGYTQFDYRGRGVKVDYDAVGLVMRAVRERFGGKRIAYPKIGAGLGGGDWPTIATIIDTELSGEDHTLVELPTTTG
jgi:O-acetyl-ADP-ribose deacetylase (regulator of RNase III)